MYWPTNSPPPPDLPRQILQAHMLTSAYVNEFLVDQHPYRKGHVCPFVKSSLIIEGVVFSFVEATDGTELKNQVKQRIQEYLDFKSDFQETQSSMVILFPASFSERTLVKLQLSLKAYCIKREIMIGALYPNSTAPSLHSEDYFPLRTPTPTLVLRDLVPMDILFLTQDRHHSVSKIGFLKEYIQKFSDHPSKIVRDKVQEARQARRALRRFLIIRGGAVLLTIAITSVSLGAYFAL
ncbi:DUF6875 domain-containing protein [Shimia sagamensis]|uniref:DUF6875 domain-containing protein n=1 Tax=Shimia sagamensis TaxID=1566352 RepID=A0ABY1PMJ0_9RHOB|nr:hypothetical protein [Shimia sagamensis]SMP35095.1 hypothetical protein SAMN06265373_1117 [Shimia sagamensis]